MPVIGPLSASKPRSAGLSEVWKPQSKVHLESRGISAEEAENIMARAAIERLARTMEDETAREAVLKELEEVL